MKMKTFNGFTGQMAQLEFSIQLIMKVMSGEDCSNTLKKARDGELYDNITLRSIEKKVKRIENIPESDKKEKEIWGFKKKLFAYCGLKE